MLLLLITRKWVSLSHVVVFSFLVSFGLWPFSVTSSDTVPQLWELHSHGSLTTFWVMRAFLPPFLWFPGSSLSAHWRDTRRVVISSSGSLWHCIFGWRGGELAASLGGLRSLGGLKNAGDSALLPRSWGLLCLRGGLMSPYSLWEQGQDSFGEVIFI